MSDLSTVNPQLTLSDSMVQTVMTTAMDAVEAEIIAQVPILGAPVIKQVMELVLKLASGLLQEQLQRVATFVIVDAQTSAEHAELVKAAGVLAAAQATGNQDAIDEATINFKVALARLVHFDGS